MYVLDTGGGRWYITSEGINTGDAGGRDVDASRSVVEAYLPVLVGWVSRDD